MGLSAMNAITIYCDFCGHKLTEDVCQILLPITTKKELNMKAHKCGWFHDDKSNKNVCSRMECVSKRNYELKQKE